MKLTEAITFKHLIKEARRNPEMNEKVSINQRVIDHLDDAGNVPGSSVPNSFVSFTEIDKLGINPNSRFKTPFGIYSYPSYYVADLIGPTESMSNLPYVGNVEFANIFSVKGNILDLGTISSSDLSRLYQLATDMYIRYAEIQRGTNEWKNAVDYLETNVFDAATTYAKLKTNGGLFWWMTMEMSAQMMKFDSWRTSSGPVSWNKVFLAMGIDGCIDSEGEGIIHTNEMTQAVFFSSRAIANVERHYNRYSPVDFQKSIEKGEQNVNKVGVIEDIKKRHIETLEMLEGMKEDDIENFVLDNTHLVTGFITKEYLQEFLIQSNSSVIKKWVVYASVLEGDLLKVINFEFVYEKIAPDLTERDIAFIANETVKDGRDDSLHSVIALKDYINIDLINNQVIAYFSDQFNMEGIHEVVFQMKIIDIFEKNIDFVIRLIEKSVVNSPKLSEMITYIIEKNKNARDDYGSLYDISFTYINRRIQSPEYSFDDLMQELRLSFNGYVDPKYSDQLEEDLADEFE